MKKLLLTALTLLAVLRGNAQTYSTIPITLTGFNVDLVANGIGRSNTSSNSAVDDLATNWTFMAQDFEYPVGTKPTSYLPASGTINSAATSGLTFQLAPYSGNNALRVEAASSGTLTFATPQTAEQVYLLVASGYPIAASAVNYTVTFTDATTQVFPGTALPNWYNGTNFAIKGIGRVNRTSDLIENDSNNPRIYQYLLSLSAGNTTKSIQSITFSNADPAHYYHVMGVTTRQVLPNDLAISAIPSVNSGCGLTNQETITVTIQNNGSQPQSNFDVSYQVNSLPVVTETYTGPLAAGASAPYTFTTKADLTGPNTYSLVAKTNLVGDAYTGNDSFTKSIVSTVPVAAYPYFQDFESGAGNWVSGGSLSTWALGKPAKTVINTAASGTNSWVTSLAGTYVNNEKSWVESPCMSFSSLVSPLFEMKAWWHAEGSWDGAVLQSSINGGATWQNVGAFNDPVDNYTAKWYNDNTIGGNPGNQQQGWTGHTTGTYPTSGGWVTVKHALTGLGGQASVKLRIAFGSDGSGVLYNGFAFDDISIKDKPASDAGITSITSPTTTTVLPGTPTTIAAKVKNYGTSPLTTVTLAFNVNGGTATTNAFTPATPLAPNAESSAETIGTYSFPAGVHILKTWSQDPNGAVDGDKRNDTLQMTIYSCNPLAGVYTIDKTQPASATSFQSFADVLSAINKCGIGGAVTFNVITGTGPYNEQVILKNIAGANATNTVTFNGNGNTIAFAPGATDQGIITVDNTDYVKFDNFTLNTGATGWGVQIKGGSDYTTISNNTINLPANTTSTSIHGIGVGAGTSATIATTAGTYGSNTKILNNTINSGYHGIFITGNTGANYSTGNEIKGNIVKDSYNYAISLYNTANTQVEGNDISCSTRTTVYSQLHGIVLNGTAANNIISKNRIHNVFDAASNKNQTVFGINNSSTTAPAGSENIVKNNLIYNINCTGPTYGLFTTSGGIYFYHNTVNLDYTANTTGQVNGFRQYSATVVSNVKLINNIININSGTGAGVKTAIYVESAGSTITSDNNVLFVTPGATNHFIGYYSSNRQTLADWKAVVPTGTPYDQNSVSAFPKFIDAVNGNLKPRSTDVDNKGQALAAVTDDITGPATRSTTTPDPGAYEFTAPPTLTYTWTGGSITSPSDWFDASNWDQNSIPGLSDNVVINNASVTQPVISSIGGPVAVNDLNLVAGSLTLDENSSITVSGNFTYTAPANAIFRCSSTFTYAGASAQTIQGLSYGNLVSTGFGQRTLDGNINICGSFIPGTNSYPSVLGSTIDFNGPNAQTIPAFTYNNLAISGTRNGNVTLANGTITVGSSFNSTATFTSGIFDPGTSNVKMTSPVSQTIPAISFYSLDASGGDRILPTTGNVKIAFDFIPGNGNYTVTGSTVEFNGSLVAGKTIPFLNVTSGSNYHNILISGTGTYSFGGPAVVTHKLSGNFTQTNGTVNVNNSANSSRTLDVSGDLNISGGSFRLINVGTALAQGATVNATNVNITGPGGITGTGSINLESTSSTTGAAKLVVSGNLNSNTSAVTALDFGTGTITNNEVQVAGNLTMSGTGKVTMSATTSIPTGLVFNGTGTQMLNSSVVHSKVPLTVNAGSTVQLASNFSVAGAIISSTRTRLNFDGTLDLAGYTMTADNTNNAAIIVNPGGLVTTGTGTLGGFAAITVNPLGTFKVDTGGKLNVDPGSSLDLGTSQLTGTGTVTINGTLKTAKTEGLSGAANTALPNTLTVTFGSASTIEYNGTSAQTISARPDYQNLTISGARGGAAITLEPGTIGVAQTFSPAATGGTWSTTGNTVDFKGSTAQIIPAFSYDNLTSSSTGDRTISGTGIVQIAGTFTPGSNTYTVTGSTVEFNGTGTQTIPAFGYNNLTSSSTGARTISGIVKIAGAFTPGSNAYTVTGSTVEFNGNTQNVPVFDYNNLTVSGSDNKALTGNITVAGTLNMSNGILQTGAKQIVLTGSANLVETSASYVTGTVETVANMNAGGTYTFNGIGLELSPQTGSANPGMTTVHRVTGTRMSGNGNLGIGRYYEIAPANNSGLDVTMVFSYQDHELNGLNEANLVFFKSALTAGPWALQGALPGQTLRDVSANKVTLNGITDFSILTLADENAPLPVELIAFGAKKVGADVEVTWTTASEKNSQGFEVQVSTNGKEFRKLGFVESRNGNSLQQYRFVDVENGKTGIRYYRLKQVDFDGAAAYFGPKAVRFDVLKPQLSVYPNPFEREMNLNITAAETGKAHLTLRDLTGKVVFEREVGVLKGNNKLTIGLEANLPAGVYLLQARFGDELVTTRLLKK